MCPLLSRRVAEPFALDIAFLKDMRKCTGKGTESPWPAMTATVSAPTSSRLKSLWRLVPGDFLPLPAPEALELNARAATSRPVQQRLTRRQAVERSQRSFSMGIPSRMSAFSSIRTRTGGNAQGGASSPSACRRSGPRGSLG